MESEMKYKMGCVAVYNKWAVPSDIVQRNCAAKGIALRALP